MANLPVNYATYITGSWAKEKQGLEYYRCYNSECISKSRHINEKGEYAYLDFLDLIKPQDELIELYKKIVTEKRVH